MHMCVSERMCDVSGCIHLITVTLNHPQQQLSTKERKCVDLYPYVYVKTARMIHRVCVRVAERDSRVPNSNIFLRALKTSCYFFIHFILACVFTCEQYEGGQAGEGRGVQV